MHYAAGTAADQPPARHHGRPARWCVVRDRRRSWAAELAGAPVRGAAGGATAAEAGFAGRSVVRAACGTPSAVEPGRRGRAAGRPRRLRHRRGPARRSPGRAVVGGSRISRRPAARSFSARTGSASPGRGCPCVKARPVRVRRRRAPGGRHRAAARAPCTSGGHAARRPVAPARRSGQAVERPARSSSRAASLRRVQRRATRPGAARTVRGVDGSRCGRVCRPGPTAVVAGRRPARRAHRSCR